MTDIGEGVFVATSEEPKAELVSVRDICTGVGAGSNNNN